MITVNIKLDGLARRLVEISEEELFLDGIKKASEQARTEVEINFLEGGRPPWNLTKDGRVPLYVTGKLKKACGENATMVELEEGFTLLPDIGDREIVAEVQDARYGIYELPDDALKAIADSLEEGMLEG